MNKYPFLLSPVSLSKIWGGNRLKTKYRKVSDSDYIGESWELTVRPEAQSVIANGEYTGRKLSEVLGCSYGFPLLIKFIDAGDDLSVQVHPDDSITDSAGDPLGKTEMWYIIDADEDAFIIYGLSDGFTLEEFENNVHKGDFSSGLRKVFVKPGDCYFIPAGQVHAIGKGILLAEIQQNSDTTYRLYDYGRPDTNGKLRELHVDKALKVIKAFSDDDIYSIRYSEGKEANCLVNCEKFKCSMYSVTSASSVNISSDKSFTALVFIEGEGSILCNGERYPAMGGDTYYIPEGLSVDITGNVTFLSANPKPLYKQKEQE